MKGIVGLILIGVGVILGIYVGVWVLFIGGILQIAQSVQPVNAVGIAWGIIRILFSWIGWLIVLAGCGIGGYLVK